MVFSNSLFGSGSILGDSQEGVDSHGHVGSQPGHLHHPLLHSARPGHARTEGIQV